MAERYWVIGGEYADTSFRYLASGAALQRFGPFDSLAAARDEWAGRSMATVDDAHMRFQIIAEGGTEFWIVGGEFADTSFSTPASGQDLQRHGPYADEDAAREKWLALSMATIDDAHVRYRIEQG